MALVRDQSVKLFQVVDDAFVQRLKTPFLLCAVTCGLVWAVAYFTFSGCACPIGL